MYCKSYCRRELFLWAQRPRLLDYILIQTILIHTPKLKEIRKKKLRLG